jgi:hypothetical protein
MVLLGAVKVAGKAVDTIADTFVEIGKGTARIVGKSVDFVAEISKSTWKLVGSLFGW